MLRNYSTAIADDRCVEGTFGVYSGGYRTHWDDPGENLSGVRGPVQTDRERSDPRAELIGAERDDD